MKNKVITIKPSAKKRKTKFFTFDQNNSGGSFVRNDHVDAYVIIEATDMDDANRRAESIGIYFNGVRDGYDCGCCGDRWSEQWNEKGTPNPTVYGKDVSIYKPITNWGDAIVHYTDGTKKIYKFASPKRS